jgi:hypothetical protein
MKCYRSSTTHRKRYLLISVCIRTPNKRQYLFLESHSPWETDIESSIIINSKPFAINPPHGERDSAVGAFLVANKARKVGT